jgi:hypothetical protein
MKRIRLFEMFASLLFLAMPSAVLAQPRIHTEPTPLDLTYNGNAQQLLSPGDVDYGRWQYSLTSGGDWSYDIPTATSAGEYPVYVRVVASDGPHYNVYLGPIIATIKKAAPEFSRIPIAKSDLMFNGKAQALVNTGFTDDGVVEYRLGNSGSWGTGVPTAVNAGEYIVHYRIVNGENHYDGGNNNLLVTIGTRYITATIEVVPNPIECTGYTVKPSTVKVMDSGIGYTLIEGEDYTLTNEGGVAPGNYEVTVTGKGNYMGSQTVNYSIVGSLSSADVKLDYASAVYTGSALTPNATVKIGSITLENGTDYTVEYFNNVNVGTATVKVIGLAGYTGSATATFNITPKQLTEDMVTLNEDRFTYSGGPQKPEVSVKDGGAALATSDYLLDNAGGTNADNYYVTVYGANNYTGTVTKMYIISPKNAETDPSITAELVDGDNFVYKGVSQTPNIRVKYDRIPLEEVIDYTISYQGVTDPSYNSNMAPIAAGKYNAVVNFTRNYSGEKEVEFTINKAPLTITADDFTVVYGEDAPQYTVTYKTFQGGEDSDVLDGALAFDCLYEAGKPVNTYSITPKGFESDNYEIEYKPGTLTVVKADAKVVTAPVANDLTYNATEQELVVAGSAEGGVMKYSLDGNNYSEEVPTAVNAGVYSVYYKVEADGNHNDYVAPEPIAVEIKKAELTATADDFTIIYGKPAPNYTISYDGWQGSDDESVLSGDPEFACDYEQGSPVGKYVIVPSGVEANNYNIEFINGTLIVNPKSATDPDITIEQIDEEPIVYKGVRQAPNIVVKDGDKVLEEVIDYAISYTGVDPTVYDSKMAPIAAGTYNVVATMKRNYTDAIEIEFTIDPAPLTITADNFEVVYGNEAPDFTVTYKTFQGGEDPDVLEGDLAFDCSYAVGSGVGTYTITPSGLVSNNYAIEYVEGTLTVVPAELAITADDKSVIYGDEAPEFTVSYDGFKAGDDESVLDGQIENTCEYAPGSFVGEYAITPSGVTSENYNITFIDGKLTVNRAEVYVSGATVYPAKFEDGGIEAVITDNGELNGVKLQDVITHTVTSAVYSDAAVGENKTITLTYELNGDADLLTNYLLKPVSEDYALAGSIIEKIIPDNEYQSEDEATMVVNGIEIYAYGYCDNSDYSLKYHLKSGTPDQYKIVFDSDLIEDVDWTDLETPGKEGVITLALPDELPAGDYNMTVSFRDGRFDWLESSPIPASIHATVAESFVVPLFNNTIAIVDTCQCFSDIQWFYRANETEEWEALRGATGYYYHSNEKLTGEYFVRANMNGVNIYSCPQKDMDTLYGSNKNANVTVSATPNPVIDFVTISIEGSKAQNHTLKIVNMSGVEVFSTTFDGNSIRVDMTSYQQGNYVVNVDGVTAKVIKE